jgi:phenylacetate-coenzyme A ligase PaaK-like adenylate-forming protein
VTLRELGGFSTELLAAYRRTDGALAAIQAVRDARTRQLIDAARRTRRLARLERLEDAPVFTKAQLQANFDATVVTGGPSEAEARAFLRDGRPGSLLHGRYVVATTSGTTGEVGLFVTDDAAFARLRATVFARIFRGQLTPEGFALLAKRRYRLAFVIATGSHTMTSVLALRMPAAGRLAADVRIVDFQQPLPRLVEELNAARPLLLHSYATVLELLAHEQLAGRLRVSPEIVTAGSEALTAQARQTLQAAFPQARVLETWAATEHVALAVSCPRGHLHLNADAAIIEPVDADDRAVPVGVWSERVLITNLLNTTQPLLRYRLDDRVRVDDAACPCGSSLPRVEVEGRTDDTIYLDDGEVMQAHTPIPLETALLGLSGLRQFAIVHDRQNHLQVAVVAADDAMRDAVVAGVSGRLAHYLAEHGLRGRVDVDVTAVAVLPRNPRSGKLRQITSLVPKPPSSVPAPTRRAGADGHTTRRGARVTAG